MNDTKYEVMDDGSLMIKHLEENDNGYYECMVKSPEGVVKSRPARMVVRSITVNDENGETWQFFMIFFSSNYCVIYFLDTGFPSFLVKPKNVTTTPGDEGITLDCQADGDPQPIITWSRNGVFLGLSTRHYLETSGKLVIRPVRTDDYGTYRCTAENKYGRISAEAEVVLNGKI